MPMVEADHGPLWYRLVDLTPPWLTEPETILFHHGVGIDHGIWAGWLPELADRYRLLTFDMRGYGRSHLPEDGFAWSLELLAADALAVAEAAGAERVHFVGESMGGAVGLYLATTRHRARLRSLTACTSPHKGASVRWLVEWRDYIDRHGMEGWSERMMERRFYPNGLIPAARAWFVRTQAASARQSVLGQGEMLAGVDLSAALPSITTPVHLITADNSPFLPLGVALEIRDAIPGAELRVIPNARHGVVFSHAGDCARSLRAFLGRLGAG